ncbi:anti-sigma factor [Chryseoglobus sp. 28M-23]|uniref:anti-sigma factor n=1 Tax=Chryseoglobus sp. 28M-23 TaxID=2772253 RepID=UPI001745FAD3|nr:anti-sigma factor [Chryseoglobus sp. 28M-23]QOD92896.1 anti-sigma factor [Chryseoglobus sp. 28M-23]
MRHLDPETAALLALGEQSTSASERAHLEACAACRHEVAELQETVTVARSSLGEAELQEPPARVWQGIQRELGLSAEVAPSASPPVLSLADARERRSSRARRVVAPLIGVAAAAALIVGAVLTWNAASPRLGEQLLASAELEALPQWTDSTGSAELAQTASGERVLRVSLETGATGDGVREVWLLTEAVDGLISLGLLEGSEGEFVVPDSVDLERFSIVDVSLEPLDGDPTHSGDSIVRGPLGA